MNQTMNKGMRLEQTKREENEHNSLSRGHTVNLQNQNDFSLVEKSRRAGNKSSQQHAQSNTDNLVQKFGRNSKHNLRESLSEEGVKKPLEEGLVKQTFDNQ